MESSGGCGAGAATIHAVLEALWTGVRRPVHQGLLAGADGASAVHVVVTEL